MEHPSSNSHAEAHERSFTQSVNELLKDLPGILTDRVRLFSLELKRASWALGQMAALGLLAAILAATAWTALWVGVAAGIIAAGLAWPWAALIIFVFNVAIAVWAVLRIMGLIPLLTLPATLRRLTDSDSLERHERTEEAAPRSTS